MSDIFRNIEVEDTEEILNLISYDNYINFNTFKKALRKIFGKVPKEIIDQIIEHFSLEYGIESDADIVENLDSNELLNCLTSIDEDF